MSPRAVGLREKSRTGTRLFAKPDCSRVRHFSAPGFAFSPRGRAAAGSGSPLANPASVQRGKYYIISPLEEGVAQARGPTICAVPLYEVLYLVVSRF